MRPDGVHVLDGSYVLNAGEFHVNITNHGLIGSQYTQTYPYSSAPSGQWPGGSGDEYLWGAGLWVGGVVRGEVGVTTGQPFRELRPEGGILDTIYESIGQAVTRPWPSSERNGWRLPDYRADDDGDGLRDEDPLTGYDDDGDGLVDEDYGQIGDQMFTCTMYDDTPLIREIYPGHTPLGIKVIQHAATWAQDDLDDIVILDFEIINVGLQDLRDVYLGFYVDCDIQRRGVGGSQPDDLAGFFNGPMRGSDGSWHRMQVAWMRDAASEDPLPGWFGCVPLYHDTDFTGRSAPRRMGVRSFQIFATNAATDQEGEPRSDPDRYDVMSQARFDRDRPPSQSGDLKFLVSCGPFGLVPQGRKLNYRLALVMGGSKADMLATALRASELQRGTWVDEDFSFGGFEGHETLLCEGDLPPYSDGSDPIFSFRADFMDESCTGSDPVFGIPLISRDMMFENEDGRWCLWVNADNCEECYRAMGRECTVENGLFWIFRSMQGLPNSVYTGTWGRERHVPWVDFHEVPPLPPHVRIVPGPKQVEIFWDDVSEHDPDYYRGIVDFESYRVWRVAGWNRPAGSRDDAEPPSTAWGMIAEYDLANFVPAGVGRNEVPLPLGRNTGLEPARYVPVCLSDPRFAGLAAAMADFVAADVEGRYPVRPPLRDSGGAVIPGREPLVPWEGYPAVLDTFFAVTPRAEAEGVVGKRAIRYYHHRDGDVADGFLTFYSVVASDHQLAYDRDSGSFFPAGYGIQSEPGNNYQRTMPGPHPQTAGDLAASSRNIYVYPNPATREALAEFQQQPASKDDPTGVRVMFNNLPAARNLISIFTASGDLVATVEHDGLHDLGSASWNLVSRNGQEVVSGIYLYTVQSDDSRFEDFHGRFVVIR